MKILDVINHVNADERNIKTGFVQFYNELNSVLIELGINPLVYIALKRHENSQTKKCYPSYETIAREAGLSKATVIKHIKLLKQSELIEVKKVKGKNYYTLVDYEKLKKKKLEESTKETIAEESIDENEEQIAEKTDIKKVDEEFLAKTYTYNEKTFKAKEWQKVLNGQEVMDFYFTLNSNEQALFNQIYKR